jgi:hypothetical protein
MGGFGLRLPQALLPIGLQLRRVLTHRCIPCCILCFFPVQLGVGCAHYYQHRACDTGLDSGLHCSHFPE